MNPMSLSPLWHIALTIVAVIAACVFLFDSSWMSALVRGKSQPAPPPLFFARSPIRVEGPWRRAAYLAATILGVVPIVMAPVMGIPHFLPALMRNAGLVALVAAILLAFWAQMQGWRGVGTAAGIAIMALLLAPYALAGPTGWIRYGFVVGIVVAILAPLAAALLIRKWLFGYRPRSRAGAAVRLSADIVLAAAAVTGIAWLWYR